MNPLALNGLTFAAVAEFTTNIDPKAAFLYTVGSDIASRIVFEATKSVFAQTPMGVICSFICVGGTSIGCGMILANALGRKITVEDVAVLSTRHFCLSLGLRTLGIK